MDLNIGSDLDTLLRQKKDMEVQLQSQLFLRCDVTRHLICINQYLEQLGESAITIKLTSFFIISKALLNKLLKVSLHMHFNYYIKVQCAVV